MGFLDQLEHKLFVRLLVEINRQGLHATVEYLPGDADALATEGATVSVRLPPALMGAGDRLYENDSDPEAHEIKQQHVRSDEQTNRDNRDVLVIDSVAQLESDDALLIKRLNQPAYSPALALASRQFSEKVSDPVELCGIPPQDLVH